MKRLFCVFTFASIATLGVAADALLIVNIASPVFVKSLAVDYQIEFVDQTNGGPFVLYSVDEARKETVESQMLLDPRVVWVEDDLPVGAPEGADQRPEDIRARVGGTIPAIFDSAAGAKFNTNSLSQINWRQTPLLAGDRQIRVAVLDTGLSAKQPVLWASVVASTDATVKSFLFNPTPYDQPMGVDSNGNGVFDEAVGHGTFVASIVHTLAPYAKLVVAKVADSDGNATSWTIIKGLVFAVNNGCEFANVSLGSIDQPAALGDVIEWAESKGLVVVAGAGNNNEDRALYPARFSEVIGVSGVDEDDHKADFSNWDGHLRQAAPSIDIAGAWWDGGMVGWSGTSFAAPFVTGCLADTARKRPLWTPSRVLTLCDTTGVDIDSKNPAYNGELGLRLDWSQLMKKQLTKTLLRRR